jgi:BirA family transcriptional regulator, biotin operon repressor / biotin---[acetyl-CoA-carboxylase] ligase
MPGVRFTDVRRFESIDSTNRYLLDEARAGAPAGVVAVADYQTAGRGRRGRRWSAPAGSNLLVSVLLRPRLPAQQRHLSSAAVTLAARDAVRRVTGATLGIKWPNDLVITDGRKVAGVLAETDTDDGERPAVVVGIGINCNWPGDGDADALGEGAHVEDLARAVSLRQLSGGPVDREAVLSGFLEGLGPRVDALDEPSTRARLQADLRAACTTLGTLVRVELADRTIEGTASDLTDDGHLVVDTDRGPEKVVTGDVVHLRDARLPDRQEGMQG